jgi:hypothetical protein
MSTPAYEADIGVGIKTIAWLVGGQTEVCGVAGGEMEGWDMNDLYLSNHVTRTGPLHRV